MLRSLSRYYEQRLHVFACVVAAIVAVCVFWSPGGQGVSFELHDAHMLDANQLAIRVTNSSSEPITIVGCQSSCSCGYVTGLPVVVPSRKTIDLGLVLSSNYFRDEQALTELSIRFFLDLGGIKEQQVDFQINEFLNRRRGSTLK